MYIIYEIFTNLLLLFDYLQREQRQQIEEPGPPSRPALPQRVIVVPDPPLANPPHANRPLPPTPKSSEPTAQTPQQQQRNSQNNFKPSVCTIDHACHLYIHTYKYIQPVK